MATVLLEQPTRELFDPKRLWHRDAPRRLVEKWKAADAKYRWTLWQKHLARRKRPRQPSFLTGKRPPLLWCWPDEPTREALGDGLPKLVERVESLAATAGAQGEPRQAIEAVAAAYALPELAAELPAGAWWKLAESLHDLARDAQAQLIDITADSQQAIWHQLVAGELPLALSYLLPELSALAALGKPARRTLSEAIEAATDGRGQLHARLLPAFGPLMASWTRVRWIGERMKRGCWSSGAETQYEWLIRRALQLTDRGHRMMLNGDGTEADARELRDLLAAAIDLAGDKCDCAAAAAAVSRSIVPEGVRFSDKDLPKASYESEWAGVAMLASDWSKASPRLALAFADDPPTLELRVDGKQIFAGAVSMETTCNGHPVAPIDEWEEICWQSDEDCDYLELGIELADGLTLERQILLAKQDATLFMADVILAEDREPRELRHTLRLPLGRDAEWRPEKETRDGLLVAGKRKVAVLPLGLAEWRSDPRGGELAFENGTLTLTQQANGAALSCPLLFDLKSARSGGERTWRQLAVAEMLQVVPRDVAVGYRVQSLRDQWLFYRSLAPAGNRTVLGQNISGEFFAGRFLKTGEVDEWIEIEADI